MNKYFQTDLRANASVLRVIICLLSNLLSLLSLFAVWNKLLLWKLWHILRIRPMLCLCILYLSSNNNTYRFLLSRLGLNHYLAQLPSSSSSSAVPLLRFHYPFYLKLLQINFQTKTTKVTPFILWNYHPLTKSN